MLDRLRRGNSQKKAGKVKVFFAGTLMAAGGFFGFLGHQVQFTWQDLFGSGIHKKEDSVYLYTLDRYVHWSGFVETRPNGTVSESQAYMMLIAVGENDRTVFRHVWNWTKTHLQRGDGLFAWQYSNGKVTDWNAATDADTDIAYALHLAARRWNMPQYDQESKKILQGIWNNETKKVAGTRYVTAGNWTAGESGATLNPSYLAPYAYRVFAQMDPSHDWMELVDSSYKIYSECRGSAGLPTDWCRVDSHGNFTTNFQMNGEAASGYDWDAIRVPYRVALDYEYSKDPRALSFLKSMTVPLAFDWNKKGEIFATYRSNGTASVSYESGAHYAALLPVWRILYPNATHTMYVQKLSGADPSKYDFYNLAWMWLGMWESE
ncbi:MAG TPA: glycosyl hydrolase family 8 [Candidatus Paceibacterota bacterium]|nr:glycosyl hydrolase family 8 [Candidatus Paceibacterota bacterium]